MKKYCCPICESTVLHPFLQRSQVPVHQNLVVTSQLAARAVTRGDLDLVVCEFCGFIFNQSFDFRLLNYGENYDSTRSLSGYFDAYLDGLVYDMVEHKGIRNCTIVEVGCGQGEFLKKLVEYPGANNVGYGFDPSYIGPTQVKKGNLEFRTCYYDNSCTDITVDVVVCRHVIEHISRPLSILQSVRAALVNSPNARVFFETPCVDWILKNRVIWDLFYEHCSLFAAQSLTIAFQRVGFFVERVEHIFGNQYLWLEACISDTANIFLESNENIKFLSLATAYAVDEKNLQQDWLYCLSQLSKTGKIALWGAGAKGATFANLIDPECTLIDCVVDLNLNKQGCFIPGTGHPIVAPIDLIWRGVSNVVLMNPNYRDENIKLLARADIKINFIDLIK